MVAAVAAGATRDVWMPPAGAAVPLESLPSVRRRSKAVSRPRAQRQKKREILGAGPRHTFSAVPRGAKSYPGDG